MPLSPQKKLNHISLPNPLSYTPCQGAKGTAGGPGKQGNTGTPGEKGDDGEKGMKGDMGQQGTTGFPGDVA